MEWNNYPFGVGAYAHSSTLILAAYPDGAWVVWDTKGKRRCAASADSKVPLSGSLDEAKKLAESAAQSMTQ